MNFKCLKKDIQNVISITEDIVAGKIVYNIESNVVFTLKDNVLTLIATDNSVWVKGELELSDYSGEGSVAVYAKKIGSIIKEMPEGFLSIEIDEGNKINISSENGKIRHTIIGIQPEDFPEYPSMEKSVGLIEIPTKEFVTMVHKTISSVSKETFKPALRGIYFEKEASDIRAVATDGKRLAYIERRFEGVASDNFEIIIEPKVLSEIINVANYDDVENIEMGVGSQQVYFKCGKFQFVSTLIEGKYPNYKQVIPKEFDYSFRVNKDDLLDGVRRVIPMISDMRSKRLMMEVSENALKIKGVNREMGESVEDIEANYHGEPHKLALNYAFVQDIVKQLNSDIITFRANSDTSPAMIKEIEREDYFFIIMPMSLEEDGS